MQGEVAESQDLKKEMRQSESGIKLDSDGGQKDSDVFEQRNNKGVRKWTLEQNLREKKPETKGKRNETQRK